MAKKETHRRLGVVILAAGKGTRMESELPKVLHSVAGSPMLHHVLAAADKLNPQEISVVIGHRADLVKKRLKERKDIHWVLQAQQRGTGDAVRRTKHVFRSFKGPILVLYGDIPGIRVETLRRLIMVHEASDNAVTLITAELEDPTGYGRIVLEGDGTVAEIVEETDATLEQKEIAEINTGIGVYDREFLFEALEKLKPSNKQKELYLTDLVSIAREAGRNVGRLHLKDAIETMGINTREDLAAVNQYFYEEKASQLLLSGVTFLDPATALIDPEVQISADVVFGHSIHLKGNSLIGRQSEIGSNVTLEDAELSEKVRISEHVKIRKSKIGKGTRVGAYTVIGEESE